MSSEDGRNVEVRMYGDVCEQRPFDWWTGKPIEGDFIIQDEFIADLDRLKQYSAVTLRISSYGGDTVAGLVIHNRLRDMARDGIKLTAVVDGVAMSAASVIMCACDDVVVNPTSLVMVHKCWTPMWGGYNADDLRREAATLDKYDKALCAAYERKTGMSSTKLQHMMAETTYMTGKEAIEKGFANRLSEDAEPVAIAASADGRSLFINNKKMHLSPGMFAPDFIPTIEAPEEPKAAGEEINKNELPVNDSEEEGGEDPMTIEELRAQYPEMIAEIEAEARNTVNADEIRASAVDAERARMREIDGVASLFSAELVAEARYGETACSAQELSYRAAQQAAAQGRKFLAAMMDDAEDSNAEAVEAVPGDEEEIIEETPENISAAAKKAVENYIKKTKEAK